MKLADVQAFLEKHGIDKESFVQITLGQAGFEIWAWDIEDGKFQYDTKERPIIKSTKVPYDE